MMKSIKICCVYNNNGRGGYPVVTCTWKSIDICDIQNEKIQPFSSWIHAIQVRSKKIHRKNEIKIYLSNHISVSWQMTGRTNFKVTCLHTASHVEHTCKTVFILIIVRLTAFVSITEFHNTCLCKRTLCVRWLMHA